MPSEDCIPDDAYRKADCIEVEKIKKESK